jgi:hypothetical protein
VKSGKVQGKTAERHTSAEFVDFLEPSPEPSSHNFSDEA